MRFSWRGFITVLSVLFMLYCVIYVLDLVPMLLGKSITGPQHLGVFLGIILFTAYLILPAKRGTKRDRPPWYDIILAVLCLVPTLYYSISFETTLFELPYTDPMIASLGWLLIILVLEASRRALGWPFAGLVLLALLYLYFGNYFPGPLEADHYSLDKIGGFMYVSHDGIIGIPANIASKIIVIFLLFAQVLFVSGAGDWFVDIANSMTGHVRGGPAKASVIASGGFGMLSPAPQGNVASTGVVTIPLMKKTGFQAAYAAGVEAVASTGGQIMPPVMGSIVFILSEYVGIPYGKIIIYAFIPAVLYYLALFVMVDLNAAKRGLKGLPRTELPPFVKTARQGYWYLIPIAVLVLCLIVLAFSPEKSAIWALISLIVVSLFRKNERVGFSKLIKGAELGLRTLVPVAVACAGVGIIIGALTLSLLSFRLTFELVGLAGNSMLIILALAAIIAYIMGMGVGPMASYLTLAMMVAPSLVQMGVPVLSAHLFLLYWAITCFITPPYAMAAFVAAGIAECDPWRAGFNAMRLGVGTFIVPFIFVYKPALILIGAPLEIATVVLTSLVGIASISAGLEGYILKKLNWPLRIIMIAGGAALALTSGLPQIIGGVVVVIIFLWQLISIKIRRPETAAKSA